MNEIDVLWVVLVVIFSAGLCWLQYQTQFKKRSKQVLYFAIPRFLAYVCIGLLLINPKIKQTSYTVENPNLIIGVDNSMSIAQIADTTTYKSQLNNFIDDGDIKNLFNIQAYSFGDNYNELKDLNFNEPQTNISRFLKEMSGIYSTSKSHILLFTDGQATLGQDYIYTSKSIQDKIISVVVGDTTSYIDTKIDRINSNSYAFLNNRYPVEVFLSYNGESPVNTDFILKQNGKILSRTKVSFSENETTKSLTLFLKADQIGVNTIEAELETENEKNTKNNTREFAVEVIDERTKILLLYNKLHPDIGMFKKSIESNPQRQFKFSPIEGHTEDLATYNLILFYQPDISFQRDIEFVKKQSINHIIVTGSLTDYNFLNRVQSHFKKTISRATEDYYADLNPTYSSYQIEDIGFENFPPLKNSFGDIDVTSEADIMLYQSINGFSTQDPLIMTVVENNNKVAYIFGENIWRWRMKSYVDNSDFKAFDRFLDQLIQFTSSTETKKRLVTDIKSFYNRGNNNVINVQYFDKNYNFDPGQKISLSLQNKKDNKKYSYNLVLKNNRYSTKINDLPAGEYTYRVSAENQNLSDSGQFKVLDFLLEKSFYRADAEKLEQASDTIFYRDQFMQLKNYLITQQEFKPIQKSIIKKESLINWRALLILIIVFLSLEWFSRKYHGLI
jgi:hypothetical protein